MQPTGASDKLIPPTMPAVYLPAPPHNRKHHKPKPTHLRYCANFPTPQRTDTQYLLKVHATALCRGELEWPHLLHRRDTGAIIGHDICGIVLSTPVTDEHLRDGPKFKVGDHVFGLIELGRDGAAADCVAAEEDELAFKPKNLCAVEAASLPHAALMAYQALVERLGVETWLKEYGGKEETRPLRVLVLGADGASGVGMQAIQMLRSRSLFGNVGVWICATAKTKGDESVLRNGLLRVDEVIDCEEDSDDLVGVWRTRGLEPVHLVLDCVGDDETLRQARNKEILREDGRATTAAVETECQARELSGNRQISSAAFSVEPDAERLEIIRELVERGELKPYVDKVFDLHEAKEAMMYIESGRARGKVVLRVNYD
ncbi:hypothetical protein PRK78_000827 [Emydomyces testavorans]|uniref:Enoyl reductase (ER) domain-containing protein n=1 Tax=Emydomyces testavorans TaxID=2070801 RepID=A0AAF0DBG0_9EURO|nr:hypothetical protein PRK78_000827 [Emydomyces testavorans]